MLRHWNPGPIDGQGSTGSAVQDLAFDRSALAVKLALFGPLDPCDIDDLNALSRNARTVGTDQLLLLESAVTDHLCLLVEGFAYRFKMLPGGRRQILGYLVPGDMCDPHYMLVDRPDHSLAAMCESRVVQVPIDRLAELARSSARVAATLAIAEIVDNAILREWLLNVGQRSAAQRLAHFLCEIEARLTMVGQVGPDGAVDLPVNQHLLADTIGMTVVHTNRVLQGLRRAGLICFRQRRLTILNRPAMVQLAGFDGHYLHPPTRRVQD